MTALRKRYIVIVLSLFLLIGFPDLKSATGSPTPSMDFTAEGIVLMDADTGSILYEKNMHQVLYPASTTKILTAILALEQENLNELVMTSSDARHAVGNRIYLSEGEEKPLIDLVYGTMLNSGNDAAIAIAEHIGGTVEGFSKMMNDKARDIGAINSNFVNPSGLPDDDHVTTAYDLAKIGQYALRIETLREIATTQVMPWIGEEWVSNLVNTNRLLWEYEGATGLKTGYTTLAQQTFVGSAKRDGMELIVVLLRTQGRNNLWKESKYLLDFGFEHFEKKESCCSRSKL
ncbi:MAG: D-alanyl-D-alanine carboxypeptidase [Bacillaceae bacterium]|nr:D-alanyl-D-alanine carboxypeptidase [Bacillaceae bacterium]